MTTLGVDLSIASCGLAVVRDGSLLFVQTKRTNKQVPNVERRLDILQGCKVLLKAYGYTDVVFESARLFHAGHNAPLVSIASIISLSTTIEDWAWEHSVKVHAVATNSWRKVVLGSGRAQKADATAYVLKRYGKALRDDAAEAVCQALWLEMRGVAA